MVNPLITSVLNRLESNGVPLSWFTGKRVLVTGGAGFIGSWLVEALAELGAKVYIVDNLWRGSIDNLKREDGSTTISLKDQFLYGDLCDYQFALASCKKSEPEIVFHLADIVAGINFVFANESFIFRTNMLINSNVYNAVSECGINKVVYLGTACSYPKHLQQQTNNTPIKEDDVYPAHPESAYGWSKLMGEYELELLEKSTAISAGILRVHNVYGPRALFSHKRSQVIPSLIRKAIQYPKEELIVWGSGKQTRDFVFVGDLIDAILRLPSRGLGKGVIQIGTAKETPISELASLIVKISGKKIPIIYDMTKPEGDIGRSGNYSKATEMLGWKVFTSLESGLRQTYEWEYRQIVERGIPIDE